MAQTISWIRSHLAARGFHPKKHLGQNFLVDGNHLRRIVAEAGPASGDLVLEVGCGTGTLTEALLEAGAEVVGVEIDPVLLALLEQEVQPRYPGALRLVAGDVLAGKHAVAPGVAEALRAMGEASAVPPFTLVANLPYQVASPLLVNLAAEWPAMAGAVVMVQREVADRLAAAPGGKTYGPLTVMVQAFFEVAVIQALPPQAFWPAPKVTSAVVRLRRRPDPATSDPAGLSRLLHRLFTRRRQTLRRILGADFPWPAGIAPGARPGELSVAQLASLARHGGGEAGRG